MENSVLNKALKYGSYATIMSSLFYLVLTGKMAIGDYQTLAVGALGALGGYHAGSRPTVTASPMSTLEPPSIKSPETP